MTVPAAARSTRVVEVGRMAKDIERRRGDRLPRGGAGGLRAFSLACAGLAGRVPVEG